jgi:hypothetical protein
MDDKYDSRRMDKVKSKKDRQDGVYSAKHVRQVEKLEGTGKQQGQAPAAEGKKASK